MTELESRLIKQNEVLSHQNQELLEQVQDLLSQIHCLNEQLQYFTRKFFGTSREKVSVPLNQLSLFEGEDFLMSQRKLKTKPSRK